MTGRANPEWIGKSADSKIPDDVKLRIWERDGGRCHISGLKIMPGDAYDWEHKIPLSQWTGEGHGNRESNIAPALRDKHRAKTGAEATVRAKGKRVRKKHLGIKKSRNPLPGSRASGIRKRMNGTVERW